MSRSEIAWSLVENIKLEITLNSSSVQSILYVAGFKGIEFDGVELNDVTFTLTHFLKSKLSYKTVGSKHKFIDE